jgi:hypothetical protein
VKHTDVVPAILELCRNEALSFQDRATRIAHLLDNASRKEVLEHLDHAGIIPECFHHDSTEEKLFAKYCDTLLARAWGFLGLAAETIPGRSDAADVVGRARRYTVVGDAKAFRLSRTAKNQKDFKVEALNSWRRGAEYASLVCPLYQYPTIRSQIYEQAGRSNVTLLSYTHLAFLIRKGVADADKIKRLWEVGTTLSASKDAMAYWDTVQKVVLRLSGAPGKHWRKAVEDEKGRLPRLAQEQIAFLEREKGRIKKMTREEAVEALIAALKIDSKISVIQRNTRELQESTESFED